MKEMYKKILKSADFLLVIAFVCLPPVFAPPAQPAASFGSPAWYPAYIPAVLQIAALLLFSKYKPVSFCSPAVPQTKVVRYRLRWTSVSLALLMCSAGIIAMVTRTGTGSQPYSTENARSFFTGLVLPVVLFAAREEIIYRLYLVNAAIYAGIPVKAAAAISVPLFAAAHSPAGAAAIINAAIGGAILTGCRYKTGSLLCPLTVHSIYNIVLLLWR